MDLANFWHKMQNYKKTGEKLFIGGVASKSLRAGATPSKKSSKFEAKSPVAKSPAAINAVLKFLEELGWLCLSYETQSI